MRAWGLIAFMLMGAGLKGQHNLVEGPIVPAATDSTYRLPMPGTPEGAYRFMTYNLRYAGAADGPNAWDQRFLYLIDQIQRMKPDVLGTQEGLYRQLMDIEGFVASDSLHRLSCSRAGLTPETQSLAEVYHWVGTGRDSGDSRGEHTAIFYRRDRFSCLYSETFWLGKHSQEPSVAYDAALPRIATLALLKDLNNGRTLCVLNTHFDHVGAKARAKAAKQLWAVVQQYQKFRYPVVLMGDLNLLPEEEPIRFLSSHMQEAWESTQWHYTGSPWGEPIHGTFNAFQYGKPHERRIDYVFATRDWTVLKHGIIPESTHGLYPSDHFPVLVDMRLGL
ncbi:MAG: hypothetical protein RL577_1035 [Bacteroidota bacterium]